MKIKSFISFTFNLQKSSGDSRVTFIPNVDGDSTKNQLLNKLVLAVLQVYPPEKATQFVISLLENDSAVKGMENGKAIDIPVDIRPNLPAQELSLKILRVYCQRVLKLNAGKRGIISNGRVLGPLDDDEDFDIEDFSLLERFSLTLYGDKIQKALNKDDDDDEGEGKKYF